jgi:hypothetical protein
MPRLISSGPNPGMPGMGMSPGMPPGGHGHGHGHGHHHFGGMGGHPSAAVMPPPPPSSSYGFNTAAQQLYPMGGGSRGAGGFGPDLLNGVGAAPPVQNPNSSGGVLLKQQISV